MPQTATHTETINNNTNCMYQFCYDSKAYSRSSKDSEPGYRYFGARYYEADLSVWLSVDPLAGKYPDQSPYSYVGNRPIMVIDPWGMDEIEDPNGNKGEAGKYKQTADKKYLYGEGRKTKVWDPKDEGHGNQAGVESGAYVDYEGDPIDFENYGEKSNVNHFSGKDARIQRLLDKDPNNPISRAVWALNNRGMYPHLSGSLHMGKVNYSLPNVPDMVAINLQGSCIVGGGASLNLTIGEVHGQPFFAISPSIGSGFDISLSAGLTFGNYQKQNIPLPMSLEKGFIYQSFGAAGMSTTFTQNIRSVNGVTRIGDMWRTNSMNVTAGSRTLFGGSAGAGITFLLYGK